MAAKKLQITFFNVGHGSCTHIITPNNQHFLVDVGSDEQESVVNYINHYYGLERNGQIPPHSIWFGSDLCYLSYLLLTDCNFCI